MLYDDVSNTLDSYTIYYIIYFLFNSNMDRFTLDDQNYKLNPVKFVVDNSLGDHIKTPFPNQSFFWLICGKPGSGKTSLLINALASKKEHCIHRKVFDKILLVMPKNSRKSIKKD